MGRMVRIFESGVREHRADEWELGAAAYTDRNVPERLKNQTWQVVDIDEWLAANPDPVPADPKVALRGEFAAASTDAEKLAVLAKALDLN